MTTLLDINGLTKTFGGLVAVMDFRIQIEAGQIVSIIGPNGAGKTTLFNMITGFYRPDSGSVRFCGRELSGLPVYRVTRAGISRTFQNIRLFSDMTVRDNLVVAAQYRYKAGLLASALATPSVRRIESRVDGKLKDLLGLLTLTDKMHLKASALSYGDQRRLEIARALMTEPKLILLDEPTAGMNMQESESIMRTVFQVKNLGITVLLIEHNMNVVMEISERVVVLDHGVKIAEGPPAEIQANEAVINAYLGDENYWDADC